MVQPRVSDFPLSEEEFDGDARISWSNADGKFILEEDNGTEWHFDSQLKRWIQTVDQQLLDQQGKAYQVEGVNEAEETKEQKKSKKRKDRDGDEDGKPAKKKEPKPVKERVSTAVYVTSIPLDATKEEIEEIFGRYGLISESLDNGEKRVKMYTDDDGNFKGEALVIYHRPESVDLAVDMLDDSDFRLGEKGPSGNMRVQVADMSFKKQKEPAEGDKGQNEEKKFKKKSASDRDKALHHSTNMNARLADWSDDEDPSAVTKPASRWDKVVVLKHMFTLEELMEDKQAESDIKEDISEEATKFGEVQKIIVFNAEVDGVATIKFMEADEAAACAKAMHGRAFDGRVIEAYIADGTERFKKQKTDHDFDEEQRRLEQFGKDLEAGAFVKDVEDTVVKNGDE